MNQQSTLIKSLASLLAKQGTRVEIFETHISWVIVAGNFAYKFKKAVHFDFVDFSTLAQRRFYCEEELRLNGRLAPDLYLEIVAVTGTSDHPVVEGSGDPIEYAVRMRAFRQEALWTHRIKNRLISPVEIDKLAYTIARFHQHSAVASRSSLWSTPGSLHATTEANLTQVHDLVIEPEEKHWVKALQAWDDSERQRLNDVFMQRKDLGFIRECHGDLHSANILTIDDRVQAFDCIEFNDSLRWIDVMNDIAFTCMDLKFEERKDLSARFLNQYLELTGDYAGLAVLQYYEVQRALIRCKVSLLRAGQQHDDTKTADKWRLQGKRYLAFSFQCSERMRPVVIITHGYSGSGKTSLSKALVELSDAIQLRSDVERKRLHGFVATHRGTALPDSELYDAAATRRTYERLRDMARQIVKSGRPVIVDAAFLKVEQRSSFKRLACELGVPFFILDLRCDEAIMRERLLARQARGSDASDAGTSVLARQLAHHDPLSDDEALNAFTIDMTSDTDTASTKARCRPILKILDSIPG
jgi:aminoglycoside phosphotransferase family enzyme/predicted kinase